ncbi:MAG TPA: hypothetical protein VGP70_29230 [Actinomadura sp.]|nr:hypothetical protein [Actinomadura sp.]
MDLEQQLREAMAEHVAEVSAPASLVKDVHRRHRRRVVRIRTTIGVAATALVAITVTPAFNVLQIGAAPVGAPSATHGTGRTPTRPVSPEPLAAPGSPDSHASTGTIDGAPARPPATSPHHGGGAEGDVIPIRTWVTYLPRGLKPAGSCRDERAASRRMTICRWTGSAGSLEVRLFRGSELAKPEDFAAIPPMPRYTTVHGHRAIIADGSGAAAQIMWIDRPGVGVLVEVSQSLRDQLIRIAEGVHAAS